MNTNLSQVEIENIRIWLIASLNCDTIHENFSPHGGIPLNDEATNWLNRSLSAVMTMMEAGMLQTDAVRIISETSDLARRMA